MAVIDNLVGDGNVRGRHDVSNATHGGNSNNLRYTQLFKPPDIGAIIYFVRGNGVGISMSGQKYDFFLVKLSSYEVS